MLSGEKINKISHNATAEEASGNTERDIPGSVIKNIYYTFYAAT